MATINVKDAAGSTVALEKPLAPGGALAAASRPVTLATDDPAVTVLGAQADAASATTSVKAALRAIATALGITALDLGSGTGGSRTLRFFRDTAQFIGGAGATTSATQRMTLASDDPAVAVLGAKTDAKSTATDATSVSLMQVFKQISASIQSLVTAIGSTAWDLGAGNSGTRTQRVIIDSSQIGSVGQQIMSASTPIAMASDQKYQTGMSPRAFAVPLTTLTRPANTTAYTAGDSISNNGTAASVTALTGTISDTNDDPITLTDILVSSTDTGLAGKRIRVPLFNSDPTANSGVQAGDNAAFSQKIAGYIGTFSGVLETGFFDGTVGRLVPTYNDGATAPVPNAPAGGLIVVKPTSGAKTLFTSGAQAVDGFTPSANSTTLIFTVRGFQGRAS